MERKLFGNVVIVTSEHGILRRGVWVQAKSFGYLDRAEMEALSFYLTSLLQDWERKDKGKKE